MIDNDVGKGLDFPGTMAVHLEQIKYRSDKGKDSVLGTFTSKDNNKSTKVMMMVKLFEQGDTTNISIRGKEGAGLGDLGENRRLEQNSLEDMTYASPGKRRRTMGGEARGTGAPLTHRIRRLRPHTSRSGSSWSPTMGAPLSRQLSVGEEFAIIGKGGVTPGRSSASSSSPSRTTPW